MAISSIKMYYQRHGCEICIATLECETSNGNIIRTIDFSGNSIGASLFGAVQIVNALQEINGQEPLGYVEVPKAKKSKAPKPKYELCDTVLPSGEKCVRPKDHNFSKCSPKMKFMEYCADTQVTEARARQSANKEIRRLASE